MKEEIPDIPAVPFNAIVRNAANKRTYDISQNAPDRNDGIPSYSANSSNVKNSVYVKEKNNIPPVNRDNDENQLNSPCINTEEKNIPPAIVEDWNSNFYCKCSG